MNMTSRSFTSAATLQLLLLGAVISQPLKPLATIPGRVPPPHPTDICPVDLRPTSWIDVFRPWSIFQLPFVSHRPANVAHSPVPAPFVGTVGGCAVTAT